MKNGVIPNYFEVIGQKMQHSTIECILVYTWCPYLRKEASKVALTPEAHAA